MIKGAIFDLDGTLLDSMYMWKNIAANYLRSIGYEPKDNLSKELEKFSFRNAVIHCKSEYEITKSVEEIIKGMHDMISHYYRYEAPLKKGVKSFLQQLKDNDVKMCIATATDEDLFKPALERLGIGNYFSEIFTCSSVGYRKTQPIIYREAMKHLGTDKSNTFVFEDAAYAIKTAKNDGFITVALFDSQEERQSEIKSLADIYMNNLSDFDSFWKLASSL